MGNIADPYYPPLYRENNADTVKNSTLIFEAIILAPPSEEKEPSKPTPPRELNRSAANKYDYHLVKITKNLKGAEIGDTLIIKVPQNSGQLFSPGKHYLLFTHNSENDTYPINDNALSIKIDDLTPEKLEELEIKIKGWVNPS